MSRWTKERKHNTRQPGRYTDGIRCTADLGDIVTFPRFQQLAERAPLAAVLAPLFQIIPDPGCLARYRIPPCIPHVLSNVEIAYSGQAWPPDWLVENQACRISDMASGTKLFFFHLASCADLGTSPRYLLPVFAGRLLMGITNSR